jgi:putative oxidoreductase
MKFNGTFVLRVAIAIILIMHSIPTMWDGSVNDFGKLYLDSLGFAPFGLVIAWAIKLSHVAAAVLLLWNRYVKPAAWVTIFILVVGIIMVHAPNGWFVVGRGQNGVEFNFLLIATLITIMYPKGFSSASK